MSSPLTVLIVEDEPEFVAMLSPVLRRQGFTVVAVGTGEEALAVLSSGQVAAVVLDINLGEGIDGYEVCRQVREQAPLLPVLMLTGNVGEVDELLGLSSGADDYVTKPFRPSTVAARVVGMVRRAEAMAGPSRQPPVQVGPVTIDPAARTVSANGRPVPLTPLETDLLVALVAADGAVVTSHELVVAGWGEDLPPSEHTLRVHLSNLRRKLQRAAPDVAVATVRGVGYRLDRP